MATKKKQRRGSLDVVNGVIVGKRKRQSANIHGGPTRDQDIEAEAGRNFLNERCGGGFRIVRSSYHD